ncbi:MAG: ATP-binding cassette domain-containing protein, partial [Cytophagales bacterium]|nr:ATP-binding cassette domain-containing protein [Cytophagales bacterium]
MNLLSVHDLHKTYPGQAAPAVQGVSFSLHKGEVLGLVGESGGGKSTLLRLIAGLDDPDGGTVRLRGEPVA